MEQRLKKILFEKKMFVFMLILSTFMSFFILCFRIAYTGQFHFVFLLWNLFLAWIPLLVSIVFLANKKLNTPIGIILFIIWLVFLPNTFYLLTDIIHIRVHPEIGVWFDLILLSSFAYNGLLLGITSLLIVHDTVFRRFGNVKSHALVLSVIVLNSFGVYLGRFLRWNSWDIITNPGDLVIDIASRITNPFLHPDTYGVTIFLSLFIATIYYTLYSARGRE